MTPRKFKTVCVVGLGYIGLPTAAVMASRGIEVIGVDVDRGAVAAINSGKAHFFEPDLDALVKGAVAAGRLRATACPEPAEAFLIAVPTPVTEESAPDLRHVEAATSAIAPVLRKGNLIILESTSPVGTLETLSQQLAIARPDLSFPHGRGGEADVLMAYCPERVMPGRMMTELVENDRVVGGLSQASVEAAAALYASFVRGEILRTDARSAEMVKLAENAFRDINIAFANELSIICDRFGIEVHDVIRLANHHPRVNILSPGPGVGGHCIAVDPWFIIHAAQDLAPLMRTARAVNDGKPAYVAARIARLARPGDTIACLGLAYKADTDDLRESPAIEVVSRLADAGLGPLLAVEPNVAALPERLAARGVEQAAIEPALARADVVLLLVAHREFRELDVRLLAGKRVHDACGAWRSRGDFRDGGQARAVPQEIGQTTENTM